jgi:acetate kinase
MAPGDGLPGERGVGTIDVGALEALLLDADLPREVLLKALRTSGGLGLREDEDLDRIALEAARGQEPARTTFETFVQVVAVAIGGAATVLGGIDALVFIGSHAVSSHRFREAVCGRLGVFGVAAPADVPVPPFEVTRLSGLTDTGPAVFAAPVNEDELVAREVIRLLLGVRGRDDEAASRRSEP